MAEAQDKDTEKLRMLYGQYGELIIKNEMLQGQITFVKQQIAKQLEKINGVSIG